jgi:uncharacterized protein
MRSCLYRGDVVHKRLAPVRHELRYRVSNFFVAVDELPALARKLRLFSYNRFNLFSIADRKHGPGDGTPLLAHLRKLAEGHDVQRFYMFCYPRILGYVFNPLTVYYGVGGDGRIRLMIYEVNNTFGGRASYVLPADGAELIRQTAKKELYVSPFNPVEGSYDLQVSHPGGELALGICLRKDDGPCLKTYFHGRREELTDAALLRSFLALPLMTVKVIAGIHWEAVKLWFKGLRMAEGPVTSVPTVHFGSGTGRNDKRRAA